MKATWRQFQQISADTKDLGDIPHYWPQAQRLHLPVIQNTARKEAVLQDEAFCLRVADQARDWGYEALLAPSATGSGTNLVIYQDKLLPGWPLQEIQRRQDIFSNESQGLRARE